MGTTSIILTLMLVASAIGIIAWLATLRHRKRYAPAPRVEQERTQEPNEAQPVTTDAVSQHPQKSLQRVADTTSIQGETPPSGEHTGGTTSTVEHENAHPDASLAPAPEAASEAAQPVALTSATTTSAEKESGIRVASDESSSLAAGEAPPEVQPPEEPRIKDQEAAPVVTEAPEERESEATLPEEAKPRRKRAPVSPEDRGGRSRETVPKKEGGGEKKRRTRTPKPEIVCWKREREWVLAVECPDDLPQDQSVTVLQNGKPLAKDEKENGCWRLAELVGGVVVRVMDAENERVFKLPLGNAGYFVFKLSADDWGRRAKNPGSGMCLAVVPEAWRRDDAKAGAPPVAPEPVSLPGYVAHFFDLSNNGSKIAFLDDKNESVVIAPGGPRFQLVGEQIHDASGNLGPLFPVAPPRISVADGTWGSVRTIVLGEEGKGAGKWRKAFKPNPSVPEQTMPDELVDKKAGWYFARFYDHEDELIDSLDFRFCVGLRQVRTQPCQPFPSADGHDVATVELELENGWQVLPPDTTHGNVTIEREGDKTLLRIPALPSCDLTRWKLRTDSGHQVEIAFLVERIWCAISVEDEAPSEWKGTPLILSVEDFLATSRKAIWLRLPRPRWTDCVLVGFQPERRRPYVPRVTENLVAIPLRDFSDAPALADRTNDCALKVWVNGIEAVIAAIPGETTNTRLDIARISACHLARSLTLLHSATRGPIRQFLKETRRCYRRPRRSSSRVNAAFSQTALCAISVLVQLANATQSPLPSTARRWKAKARLAAKQFPDAMRQVWRRYRELEGRTTGR
jgi:hypothetical protein